MHLVRKLDYLKSQNNNRPPEGGFVILALYEYNGLMEHLLFFYGLECPHCIRMERFVDKLAKEEGIKVKKIAIWNNKENDKLFEQSDCEDEPCCGVPFFLNQKTHKTICGEVTYKEVKEWAEGE